MGEVGEEGGERVSDSSSIPLFRETASPLYERTKKRESERRGMVKRREILEIGKEIQKQLKKKELNSIKNLFDRSVE